MKISEKEKTRGELATKGRVMSGGRRRSVYCGQASADGEGEETGWSRGWQEVGCEGGAAERRRSSDEVGREPSCYD